MENSFFKSSYTHSFSEAALMVLFDINYEQQLRRQNLSLEKKSIKINPFESLGITKETTVQASKKLYRKGISQKQKLILRKQKACASQILQNIQRYIQQKENQYEMPLDIFSQTTQGDLTSIIILSQNDENLLHQKDNLNQNLMYLACQAGYVHVVKYLISKQVSLEEPKKDIESRSLHVASYYGHEQIVEILLINGAEINVKNTSNNTPRDEAYNQNIVKLIDRYEWLRKNNIIIKMLYELQKQKLISIVYHIQNDNESDQPQETEDIQSLFVIPSFQNNNDLKEKSQKVIQQPQNYIKGFIGINFKDLEKVFTSGFDVDGEIEVYLSVSKIMNEGKIQPLVDVLQFSQKKQSYFAIIQVAVQHFDKNIQQYTLNSDKKRNTFKVHQKFITIVSIILAPEQGISTQSTFSIETNNIEQLLTYKQKIYYERLCLLGHQLLKQKKQHQCDLCGKNEDQNGGYCEKCDFYRCINCIKRKKIL